MPWIVKGVAAMEDAPDAEVIAAVQAGDIDAFEVLVRRYEATVAATVISMMGPGDEAEEVGHETMIKLFRSLDQFNGEAKLSTYLIRIAMNASVDALRRRRRNLKRFWTPASTDDNDRWVEQIPSDTDHARDFETRQAVLFALNRLAPKLRTVAILRLMHGLSVNEVADMLQVPAGTVLSRLSRAKRQLTDVLQKELGYE